VSRVKAKFHYTGPAGPARTRTDFFVGSVRVSDKGRVGPCGSAQVRSGPVGPVYSGI